MKGAESSGGSRAAAPQGAEQNGQVIHESAGRGGLSTAAVMKCQTWAGASFAPVGGKQAKMGSVREKEWAASKGEAGRTFGASKRVTWKKWGQARGKCSSHTGELAGVAVAGRRGVHALAECRVGWIRKVFLRGTQDNSLSKQEGRGLMPCLPSNKYAGAAAELQHQGEDTKCTTKGWGRRVERWGAGQRWERHPGRKSARGSRRAQPG